MIGAGRGRVAAGLMAAAVALAFADSSIVMLGLPEIYGELNASIGGVSLVITAYNLVVAVAALALAPVAGRVRPAVLVLPGLAVFAVSSLACGLAGSAAVLIASDEWAARRGLKVQAYLTHARVAAVDFVHGEGLLMAPTIAVPRMLAEAGIGLQDFDFYEIHEAFAAQVLCTLRAWESADYGRNRLGLDAPLGTIDPARINVNGSSLATGHPFAATGARIIAMLAKSLEDKGAGRGLVSICTAGGMGVTAILERP